METIEYRVTKVTHFVVSRCTSDQGAGSNETLGEYDSEVKARNAAGAFADREPIAAQPAEKVIRHDGVWWDRASGRWSNEPTVQS